MSVVCRLVAMCVTTLAVQFAFSASALAVTKSRVLGAGPTALCQSALPVYDGLIRKRPLAVQNEGTKSAYVTCSFVTQDVKTITYAEVWAASNDGTPKTLTCVGVTGFQSGPNQYVALAVDLPANGVQQDIGWDPFMFTGGSSTFPSSHFSISCLVAPGVSLNQLELAFDEDVGL
jgi:hypothetical protein